MTGSDGPDLWVQDGLKRVTPEAEATRKAMSVIWGELTIAYSKAMSIERKKDKTAMKETNLNL